MDYLLQYFDFDSFQRNTIKRMCIKTLPPVLCIQLKRFGYDWEANRALKFDDFFKVRVSSESPNLLMLSDVVCMVYQVPSFYIDHVGAEGKTF